MNAYSVLNTVQNMALIGVPRVTALGANTMGALMIAELAARVGERIAGGTTRWAASFVGGEQRVQSWGDKLQKSTVYKFMRPFGRVDDNGNRLNSVKGLIFGSVALLIGSNLALWGLDKIVKTPSYYNDILSNISYIRIDLDSNPFATLAQSVSSLWQSVRG